MDHRQRGRLEFGDAVERARGGYVRGGETTLWNQPPTLRWSCLLRVAVVNPLDNKASLSENDPDDPMKQPVEIKGNTRYIGFNPVEGIQASGGKKREE